LLLNVKLVAQIQQGLEVNLANSAGEHPSQHGHVVISARTEAKGKSTTLGKVDRRTAPQPRHATLPEPVKAVAQLLANAPGPLTLTQFEAAFKVRGG